MNDTSKTYKYVYNENINFKAVKVEIRQNDEDSNYQQFP